MNIIWLGLLCSGALFCGFFVVVLILGMCQAAAHGDEWGSRD